MSASSNIAKDEQTVLNFIKANMNNIGFMKKIKTLITSSNELEIPEWQQKEVLNRLEEYNKNPENVLDFDSAMDEIEANL